MGALLKQTLNKAGTLVRCDFEGGHQHYYFYCPGCRCMQFFNVGAPNSNGAKWAFDGNFESPTFTPSLRYIGGPTGTICHVILTNGILNFCGDNPHDHNNKKVPLPVIPQNELDNWFFKSVPIEKA
jgi:Family of unknown function (DUF6527)